MTSRLFFWRSLAWYFFSGRASCRFFFRCKARNTSGIGSLRVGHRVRVQGPYNAFGQVIAQAGWGDLGRYQWTGREYDAEINLQYNRARYYDPGTGRWVSQDPMGFGAGDSNLYRYCKNNPVTNTDPSGKDDYEVSPEFQKSMEAKYLIPPNDKREHDHVFVPVALEKDLGWFEKSGDPDAKPETIRLTSSGNLPFVKNCFAEPGRDFRTKLGDTFVNPWNGQGVGNAAASGASRTTGSFGPAINQMAIEWVITFSGNPRKCTWNRWVVSSNDFKMAGNQPTIYYKGGTSSVERAYDDGWHDFIAGNAVYMYNAPNTPCLFHIFAESKHEGQIRSVVLCRP